MAEIVNTFYLIDSNEDGRLSKKELNDAAFMIGMNPTTKELDAWWKEADINGQSDIKTSSSDILFNTLFIVYLNE